MICLQKTCEDAKDIIMFISMFFFLGAIPAGIISYLLGNEIFAQMIAGIWIVNLVLFFMLGSETMSDEFFFKMIARTPEDLRRDELKGEIGIICTIFLFLFLFCVSVIL